MYDIVIIGAGPAGLTAAVYARRANKTVLILDKAGFGGQITFSPKVENYPGFESVSGSELADKMVEQVLSQGADVEIENALEIKDNGNTKTVITEDGNEYECKSVIIAAGAQHRHLGLDNEERFIGDGISFCAVCDGAFYANKTVALIGGGNSALQEAILLSETSKKVYVVQNLDFLTGEQRLQEMHEKEIIIYHGMAYDTAVPLFVEYYYCAFFAQVFEAVDNACCFVGHLFVELLACLVVLVYAFAHRQGCSVVVLNEQFHSGFSLLYAA